MSALRIQKYILREATIPFFLGIVLFTFVLLLGKMLKLIELIIDKGVPATEIFSLFSALMPSFFVITVPLSFLLGTIIAFSRLSADSEIVAMKAAGLSLYQLAKPVIILALAVSLFTAWLTMYAEPLGRSNLRQQLINIAFSRAAVAIVPQVFNEDIDGLMLYANKVDSRTGALQHVFISDNRMGQTPVVITAQQGKIYSAGTKGKLLMHLNQGTVHRLQRHNSSESYQVIHFNDYDINLSLNDKNGTGKKRERKVFELSTAELARQIKIAPATQRHKYQVELNERLILPITPLIFALLAIPLGVRSHRSGRGGSLAGALFVFLIYYLSYSVSKTMVLDNGWPAFSMWIVTLAFLIVGGQLLYYSAKERRLPYSAPLQQLGNFIINHLGRKR